MKQPVLQTRHEALRAFAYQVLPGSGVFQSMVKKFSYPFLKNKEHEPGKDETLILEL